jgi:prepilin-type N-terminal cleavage/methylation domain-containing protein
MKLVSNQKNINILKKNAGFTLMEIVVATTIFAVISVALFSLFDYTLRINRRSEALRQATQGMRNFVELLVKEVRNGQIDYGVISPPGDVTATPITPCPSISGVAAGSTIPDNGIGNYDSYGSKENRLGITTLEGDRECFYLGFGTNGAQTYGTYVNPGIYTKNTLVGNPGYNPNPVLVLNKNNAVTEVLNPPNFSIETLIFYIRPKKDPYVDNPTLNPNALERTQPFVNLFVGFKTKLPTGEEVPIYYQTTVSSDKYDIPH